MSEKEKYNKIHFAIMAIESGAQKLNISAPQMVFRLNKAGLIHKRLFRYYDILHTQSLDYVTNDIIETLKNRESKQ